MLLKLFKKLMKNNKTHHKVHKVHNVFNLDDELYSLNEILNTKTTILKENLNLITRDIDLILIFKDLSQSKALEEFTEGQYHIQLINDKYYIMPKYTTSTEFGTYLFKMNTYIIYIDILGHYQFMELNAIDSIFAKKQDNSDIIHQHFKMIDNLYYFGDINLYETIIVDKLTSIFKLKTLDNDLKTHLNLVEIDNVQHLNLRGKSYTLSNSNPKLFLVKDQTNEYQLYSFDQFHSKFVILEALYESK